MVYTTQMGTQRLYTTKGFVLFDGLWYTKKSLFVDDVTVRECVLVYYYNCYSKF